MNSATPQLQKPGAGLPFFEKLYMKFIVLPRLTKRMSWQTCTQLFDKESETIIAIADGVYADNAANLEKRVLIDRLPGIEDSSRFWSIAMAMEHLMIVGQGMAAIIAELSHGRRVPVKVDIAKVKPLGEKKGKETLDEFKVFANLHLMSLEQKIKDKNDPTTHLHPWFGQMNLRKWYWLMCVHQRLHRKQIQKIVEGL